MRIEVIGYGQRCDYVLFVVVSDSRFTTLISHPSRFRGFTFTDHRIAVSSLAYEIEHLRGEKMFMRMIMFPMTSEWTIKSHHDVTR